MHPSGRTIMPRQVQHYQTLQSDRAIRATTPNAPFSHRSTDSRHPPSLHSRPRAIEVASPKRTQPSATRKMFARPAATAVATATKPGLPSGRTAQSSKKPPIPSVTVARKEPSMVAHPAIARRSSAPNASAAGASSNNDIAANVSDAAATEEATAEATAAAIIAGSSKPPVFKQKNRLRSKSLTKIKALKAMDGQDGSRGRRMSRDKAHPSLVPKQRYVTSTTVERCRSRGTLEKVKHSHPKDGNLMQIRQQPGDTSRRPSRDGEAGGKYYHVSLTAPPHHPTTQRPHRPPAPPQPRPRRHNCLWKRQRRIRARGRRPSRPPESHSSCS